MGQTVGTAAERQARRDAAKAGLGANNRPRERLPNGRFVPGPKTRRPRTNTTDRLEPLPDRLDPWAESDPTMRDLMWALLRRNRVLLERTLTLAMYKPALALRVIELAARLNRELGPSTEGQQVVAIQVVSQIPLDSMRGPEPRAALSAPIEPSQEPEPGWWPGPEAEA